MHGCCRTCGRLLDYDLNHGAFEGLCALHTEQELQNSSDLGSEMPDEAVSSLEATMPSAMGQQETGSCAGPVGQLLPCCLVALLLPYCCPVVLVYVKKCWPGHLFEAHSDQTKSPMTTSTTSPHRWTTGPAMTSWRYS